MIESQDEMMQCYLDNVKVKNRKDGRVDISCKKGFWSVSGPIDDDFVYTEAFRYFIQYYEDGEYK